MAIKKLGNSFERLGIVRKINELVAQVNKLIDAKSTPALVFTPAAGAAADTNIAIADIKTEDELIAVLRYDMNEGKVDGITNLVGEAKISSAGNIQIDTTVTTGDLLLVVWNDKSASA
jgi:hypothetical protein